MDVRNKEYHILKLEKIWHVFKGDLYLCRIGYNKKFNQTLCGYFNDTMGIQQSTLLEIADIIEQYIIERNNNER